MKIRSIGVAVQFIIFVVAATYAAPARTQGSYPSKPIYLICSSAAGGTSDLISRAIAEGLSRSMGQPVIVENQPGANGLIATERVARAAPDGYVLLSAVDTNLTVNPHLYRSASDTLKELIPISLLTRGSLALMVGASGPNNLQDLIAFARKNPKKLNYGSVGLGSDHHLGMEEFKLKTKIDVVHIPFRGTAALNNAILGGQIDMAFTSAGQAKPLLDSGRAKVLAQAWPQRSPLIPDVPTMSEAGVPGFELDFWYAFVAPAKTPQEIIDRLVQEVKKAVADDNFRKAMNVQGLEPVGSTPAELEEVVRKDSEKWRRVIEITGTKVQ